MNSIYLNNQMDQTLVMPTLLNLQGLLPYSIYLCQLYTVMPILPCLHRRVLGGIHYPSSAAKGNVVGVYVADYVYDKLDSELKAIA